MIQSRFPSIYPFFINSSCNGLANARASGCALLLSLNLKNPFQSLANPVITNSVFNAFGNIALASCGFQFSFINVLYVSSEFCRSLKNVSYSTVLAHLHSDIESPSSIHKLELSSYPQSLSSMPAVINGL